MGCHCQQTQKVVPPAAVPQAPPPDVETIAQVFPAAQGSKDCPRAVFTCAHLSKTAAGDSNSKTAAHCFEGSLGYRLPRGSSPVLHFL